MKLRLYLILSLVALLATLAPAQTTQPAVTVLDATTNHVAKNREQVHVFYGARGADVDAAAVLRWALSLPRDGYALLDYEPITKLETAKATTRIVKFFRPDLKLSWWALVDVNPYGIDRIRGYRDVLSNKPGRNVADDNFYRQNYESGLKLAQESRDRNDRYRELLDLCDWTEIHIYPMTGTKPEALAWYVGELADEAYRAGRGKPIVLFLAGRLSFDTDKPTDWERSQLAAVSDAGAVNRINRYAVWDTGTTRKQFEAIAGEVTKRNANSEKLK